MELIYIWIESYRNFKNQSVSLSGKFDIYYDAEKEVLKCKKIDDYIKLFRSPIENISAIVGKNGVGKTNLLSLIGNRMSERIEEKGKCFLIYHLRESDTFVIEGNYCSVLKCIKNNKKINRKYFFDKGWYCIEVETENDEFSFVSDYSRNSYILYFKNNDYDELEVSETINESKIMVQRKIVPIKGISHVYVIRMLIEQMKIDNREMFLDEKYTLRISYNDFFVEYYDEYLNKDAPGILSKNENKYRLLNAFVYYYFRRVLMHRSVDRDDEKAHFEDVFCNKNLNESYPAIYWTIIETINYKYLNETLDDITIKYNRKQFYELINVLEKNDKNSCFQYYTGQEGTFDYDAYLELELTRDTKMDEYVDMVKATIDTRMDAIREQAGNLYNDFFDYSLYNLSSGECTYLDLFSSIYEQLSKELDNANHYILLFDEIDQRFHPELARELIDSLITFINDNYKMVDKTIQIIFTTHSPFILTDLTSDRIVALEKNKENSAVIYQMKGKTFGANIHRLLMDEFFMQSTVGEYAKGKINEMIKNLQSDKSEFDSHDINFIESIGEPIVRDRMLHMYNKSTNQTVGYKMEVKRLEERVEKIEKKENEYKIALLKEQINMMEKQIEKLQTNQHD